ncbi:MAG TPA: nodulation protein NfeD [Eoetvoesiella sp.]
MNGALQRLIAFGSLLLLGSLAVMAISWGQDSLTQPKVVALRVDGIVSPATSDFLIRGISKAADEKAALVIIELDTPGGLDTSMRAIIKRILSSPVPIATFVSPSGARAASAGTFILYASHIAAMTPASNLGAASPVSIGVPGSSPSEPSDKESPANAPASGDSAPAGKAAPINRSSDTMTNKVTNDAAAYIRSLAELRGRNIEFAQKAVFDAASMSAQEALKSNVIDLVANDLDDLLAKVDGRQVTLDSGQTVRLATANATIERVVPDWRNQILDVIANPQVAVVLMMVGIYGLFFELTSPGMALPGVAGLICLLLGLYAFQLLPVNWVGVALIAVGAILMMAEVFLPSFGVIGAGGLVSFILGGLFLMDTNVPGFDISIPFLIGTAIVSIAFLLVIAAMAARAHKHRVVTGREEMLGLEGVVTSVGKRQIYADVRGESWRVKSNATLMSGDAVRVIAIDGLTLQVEPAATNIRTGQTGSNHHSTAQAGG